MPLPRITPVPPQATPQPPGLPSAFKPGATFLPQLPLLPLGPGTPVAGTPAALSQFLFSGGTIVFTTNASGDGTIAFPIAFPNGILVGGAWPGDVASSLTSVAVNGGGITKTAMNVRCFSGATAINAAIVRVNWFVIGF